MGSVIIDKPINQPGDVVTLTANITKQISLSSEFSKDTHFGRSITFDGWYDSNGVKLSDDKTLQYNVTKVETLEARFNREYAIKTDNDGNIYGYYRLETPYGTDYTHNFLAITGNIQYTIGLDNRYLYGGIEFNQVPYRINNNYCKTEAVYSDAASVFYVTGKADMSKIRTSIPRTQVASNLVASAQGTSTDYLVKGVELSLKTAETPGYYLISYGNFTLQYYYSYKTWVTTDKPYNKTFNFNGDLEIQPVDLEHIDTNYFGAYPAEEMEFEGGYWTSMYTSFPYECYEPDGVEAYIVSGVDNFNGTKFALVKRLESGIVPAATPVLLKCKGLTPKENRLIPLMPDDSRLAEAENAAAGNVLTGEYGLCTGYEETDKFLGRKTYDDATMRVFSVNADGEVGFYSLSANADGSPKELAANRAFLDLSKLGADAAGVAGFRIVEGESASIDGIADRSVDADLAAPIEYYTLEGIRVNEPAKGRIYIVRQGNKSKKVIF